MGGAGKPEHFARQLIIEFLFGKVNLFNFLIWKKQGIILLRTKLD